MLNWHYNPHQTTGPLQYAYSQIIPGGIYQISEHISHHPEADKFNLVIERKKTELIIGGYESTDEARQDAEDREIKETILYLLNLD